MARMIHSDTTGKDYSLKGTVRVGLPKLQALLLKHNVELLDIYWSRDIYTDEPIVVMIFPKNEKTDELYSLWKKHELR